MLKQFQQETPWNRLSVLVEISCYDRLPPKTIYTEQRNIPTPFDANFATALHRGLDPDYQKFFWDCLVAEFVLKKYKLKKGFIAKVKKKFPHQAHYEVSIKLLQTPGLTATNETDAQTLRG